MFEYEQENYQRMVERYASGKTPWDAEEPPPEVTAVLADLPPGRALDLGCGYGRSSIYMALRGWRCDGVDFVPQAVEAAKARAAASNVADRAAFFAADVTKLDFLTPGYDFALDVGCMHSLSPAGLSGYRNELLRLVKPGGLYLLYARLREAESGSNGPRGVEETAVRQLFADGFTLTRIERGETKVEDQPVWSSAWFWFVRK